MANNFSKEERVAFEAILDGFSDALTISKNVATFGTDGQLMERAGDTIWRPMPYILSSQDRTVGTNISTQTANQLSVPATLGFKKTVPWTMNSLELRDALQENRLGQAAYQRLASDINTAIRNVVSLQGTLVVTATAGTYAYSNIADCTSIMDEQGIMQEDRTIALTSRDYNGMAGYLAGKETINGKTLTAYDRAFIGQNAGFDTFKIDAGYRLAAASGTCTVDTTGTTAGSTVKYVPKAQEDTAVGVINKDNRYQTITVSSTTNVKAGDAFTIAGVEAVHHITKDSTGQLKTFRVISVDSGTTMTISPAIVGAVGTATDVETQYKNVEVASTSATAAITFLNDATANVNPFWYKNSIEILPGRYAVPTDEGAAVLRGTTEQGIEVVMTKQFDNKTFVSTYTLDVLFGVVNVNPEMNGVLLWC